MFTFKYTIIAILNKFCQIFLGFSIQIFNIFYKQSSIAIKCFKNGFCLLGGAINRIYTK